VLDLDDPGVLLFVRIVHLHGRLPETGLARDRLPLHKLLGAEGFILKPKGAIRQRAKTVVEIFVNGTSDDEMVVRDASDNFPVIGIQEHFEHRARPPASARTSDGSPLWAGPGIPP
jgi:hypothetical protein